MTFVPLYALERKGKGLLPNPANDPKLPKSNSLRILDPAHAVLNLWVPLGSKVLSLSAEFRHEFLRCRQ